MSVLEQLIRYFAHHSHDKIIRVVVMAKVLDCGFKESEFELQSQYYTHFQTNTLGKGTELPYHLSYGLNSITAFPLQGLLRSKLIMAFYKVNLRFNISAVVRLT